VDLRVLVWQPSGGSRVVPRTRTDRHDETEIRFSQLLLERAQWFISNIRVHTFREFLGFSQRCGWKYPSHRLGYEASPYTRWMDTECRLRLSGCVTCLTSLANLRVLQKRNPSSAERLSASQEACCTEASMYQSSSIAYEQMFVGNRAVSSSLSYWQFRLQINSVITSWKGLNVLCRYNRGVQCYV
jgi:hypothetical protein